ncbi:MAG TPA: MG2 domain-containing protein [Kiritimatiellia bacterium]|nr:MG2 domain-containing protein [Kiritimatiellia bacterium]HRU70319.1 MG2 domain-containing protein [Kiritimatiellia bacterium]
MQMSNRLARRRAEPGTNDGITFNAQRSTLNAQVFLKAIVIVWSFCPGARLLGADGGDFASQWQQAQAAWEQRDFKTAVTRLSEIERAAVQEQEWGHAARAVAQRIELEVLEAQAPAGSAAIRLKEEAARAPLPMRPVLDVLAARSFRSCAEQTGVGRKRDARLIGEPEIPLAEGVPQQPERLLNEIEQCYQHALAFEDALKRIPVEMYAALFDEGNVPDALRPTLFDAVAHDLLEFYAWCWRQGFEDTEAVALDADGPALQDVDGFNFVIPAEAARRSRVLRALRLWQVLLAFHEEDEDPSAYADADLNRIQFCYPLVTGEKREERYCAALDRFAHKWRTHELSARAFALRAQIAFDAGDPALARVIAEKGAAAYPASIGAAQCRHLIARIETPDLGLSAERVWCVPWPQFEISYKNLTQLHFRAVQVSFDEAFLTRRTQPTADAAATQWLKRRPIRQWGVALPPAGDYRIRSHSVSVPQDVPSGLYALFVSPEATFDPGGTPILWEVFRVSRLALVVDQKPDRVHGYVLTAREGDPVPAARVTVWRKQADGGFKREQVMMTGDDGGFAVLGDHAGEIMILAERQGDAAQTWAPLWKGNDRARFDAPVARAAFVTDRDVYRPGQALRYRGFCWKDDPVSRSVFAASGARVKVTGVDVSGRRLEGQVITCTPFGSCSGELVIPGDTPTGTFTLTADGMEGAMAVRVEAAAPSSLNVTLTKPVSGARLGDVLTVEGTVEREGKAVPGARVLWRVVRHREGDDPRTAVSLTSGSAVSDAQGTYAVTFFAKTPPQTEGAEPAAYVFTVTAEVTTADGRGGSADLPVVLGEAAWQAQLTVDAWQTSTQPVRFEVSVRALDGTAVATPGDLRVVRLEPPEWGKRPSLPLGNDSITGGCWANDGEADPSDAWPESRTLAEERILTGTHGMASGSLPLRAGAYRLVFETRDPSGRRVSARRNVRVLDPDARRLPFTVPVYMEAESWRVPAGGTFRAVWGSGYTCATALMLAESDGLELLRMRTDPEVTQQRFELPVDAAARDGFWFRMLSVKENRAYTYERRVDVVRRDRNLTLAVEDMPPVRRPGEQICCTVKVKGPDGTGCAAEIFAVLSADEAFTTPVWWDAGGGLLNGASGTNAGFLFQNHGVRLAQLCGGWRDVGAPEAWRYRRWRTYVVDPQRGGEPSGSEPQRTSVPPVQSDGERGGSGASVAAARAPRLFLPQVMSDSEGSARLSFTMPETSGRWRLILFVHDARLRSGRLDISLL